MSSGSKRRQREAEEGDAGAADGQWPGVEQRKGRGRRRDKRRRIRYLESNSSAGTAFPSVTNSNITDRNNINKTNASSLVLVGGLPDGCTVLELKSRFEMYGAISRIRIDGSSGFITFRSQDSARAAISASLDSAFGITVRSRKVHVCPVTDPSAGMKFSPSRLLRAEVPLSKHGRSNKKITAAVTGRVMGMPFKEREIIAYDDIL